MEAREAVISVVAIQLGGKELSRGVLVTPPDRIMGEASWVLDVELVWGYKLGGSTCRLRWEEELGGKAERFGLTTLRGSSSGDGDSECEGAEETVLLLTLLKC